MSVSRRRVRLVVLLLAAFVVHASLGDSLAVRGAHANLGLAALLAGCLFVRAETGAALGFLMGLLEASYAALDVGSFLVSRTLTGWAVGALEERVFRDNALVALAAVSLGTLASEGCFFLFAPQPHVLRWLTGLLGEVAYNTVLAIPLYFLARRLARAREPG